MTFMVAFLQSCWGTLLQMAPALLLGFLAAGIISAFMSETFVKKHLGGRGLAPIAKAALLGVPMPLCSCGVLPVAAALRRSGASRGAIVAFLISVPQTGADNIFVVWSLLGLAFAVYSPISAFLSGLFGGAVCEYYGGRKQQTDPGETATLGMEKPRKTIPAILKYSYLTLVDDIAGALLLGIAIAGIIAVMIPDGWIGAHLGSGFGAMILMLLAGIPVYVCSSGSVPIAAAFMAKGAGPGAALVFLITGPASNAAGLAAIARMLGWRCALLFLVSLVTFAFGSGLLLNEIYTLLPADAVQLPHPPHGGGAGSPLQLICGLILLALIAYSLIKNHLTSRRKVMAEAEMLVLQVSGMSCRHCAGMVTEALQQLPGTGEVEVDLNTGKVYIRPADGSAGPELAAARTAVEKLGFSCE
ncbi:MAG: permease [Victivallales bacterium]|nr:permease [Victivallales bacterium]